MKKRKKTKKRTDLPTVIVRDENRKVIFKGKVTSYMVNQDLEPINLYGDIVEIFPKVFTFSMQGIIPNEKG